MFLATVPGISHTRWQLCSQPSSVNQVDHSTPPDHIKREISRGTKTVLLSLLNPFVDELFFDFDLTDLKQINKAGESIAYLSITLAPLMTVLFEDWLCRRHQELPSLAKPPFYSVWPCIMLG